MPSSTHKEGFILLEALVALTMFSILSIAVMGMLQNLSSSLRSEVRSSIYGTVVKVEEDPNYFRGEPNLERLSREQFENGSVWEVYQYRFPDSQETITFPVFRRAR